MNIKKFMCTKTFSLKNPVVPGAYKFHLYIQLILYITAHQKFECPMPV